MTIRSNSTGISRGELMAKPKGQILLSSIDVADPQIMNVLYIDDGPPLMITSIIVNII